MVLGFVAGAVLTGTLTALWPRWFPAAAAPGSAEWTRSTRIFAVVVVLTSASQATVGHYAAAGGMLAFGVGSLLGLHVGGRWQRARGIKHEG